MHLKRPTLLVMLGKQIKEVVTRSFTQAARKISNANIVTNQVDARPPQTLFYVLDIHFQCAVIVNSGVKLYFS